MPLPTKKPPSRSHTTDVRRTLFRSLSRSNTTTATTSASAPTASNAVAAGGSDNRGSPFGDADDGGIIVRNEDGSLDVGICMSPMYIASQCGSGDGGDDGEQERLAEMVKRHHHDMTRKIPELLRQKVQSLAEDDWMFEGDED